MPDEESEAADLKVIETAAALRAVLLEEQEARAEEHGRERAVHMKDRRRDRIERLVTLATVLLLLFVAVGNRGVLREVRATGSEIKACTTPADGASDCQRRLAEGQKPVLAAIRQENLWASIAVGSCLSENAVDVQACAEERFAELMAAGTPPPPPP